MRRLIWRLCCQPPLGNATMSYCAWECLKSSLCQEKVFLLISDHA